MNKADIIGRVAGRMRLNRSVAEGAVDTVLGAIEEALAKEETCRRNRSTLGGCARCQAGLNGRKVAASLGTASFR